MILGTLGGILVKELVQAGLNKFQAQEKVEAILANPVVKNEVNAEQPIQSRVVVGSTVALIGAFFTSGGLLIEMYRSRNFDVNLISVQLATMWGSGYALYGRLTTGLKPLFSKWFNRGTI